MCVCLCVHVDFCLLMLIGCPIDIKVNKSIKTMSIKNLKTCHEYTKIMAKKRVFFLSIVFVFDLYRRRLFVMKNKKQCMFALSAQRYPKRAVSRSQG